MEFPRDLRNVIVSKMDIDTRRSLGIYSKLKCPEHITSEISKTFNKIKKAYDYYQVEVGPHRALGEEKVQAYTIIRFFDKNTKDMYDYRVDYVYKDNPEHMIVHGVICW